MLSFENREAALVFARFEAVRDAPETFLADLHDRLSLGPRPTYRPVRRRLGSRFKPAVERRPETPARFPEAEVDHLRARLDLPLEARIGYDYG